MQSYRYIKGVEAECIVNLEKTLSQYYESLAKMFKGTFLEREFWLTAFYLNPIDTYFEEVIRCGKRSIKTVLIKNFKEKCGKQNKKNILSAMPEWFKAKFELLSSTVDVNYIAKLTNESTLWTDYQNIEDALKSLHLPESVTRDLLTAIFMPRNKTFSWAINWCTLRHRCTRLYKNPSIKKQFIALNMADANSRLKYMNIDYSKYKNRPQLDYGTIEAGYEKDLQIHHYAMPNEIDYDEHNYYNTSNEDEEDENMTDYSDNYEDDVKVNKSKQLKRGQF